MINLDTAWRSTGTLLTLDYLLLVKQKCPCMTAAVHRLGLAEDYSWSAETLASVDIGNGIAGNATVFKATAQFAKVDIPSVQWIALGEQ